MRESGTLLAHCRSRPGAAGLAGSRNSSKVYIEATVHGPRTLEQSISFSAPYLRRMPERSSTMAPSAIDAQASSASTQFFRNASDSPSYAVARNFIQFPTVAVESCFRFPQPQLPTSDGFRERGDAYHGLECIISGRWRGPHEVMRICHFVLLVGCDLKLLLGPRPVS